MKYTTLVVGALSGVQGRNVLEGLQDTKRYSQLMAMMENYNPEFDDKKYWTYGCNCFMLGDRPMSDPGKGPAVDALDATCKRYKDCLKCARNNHGEACIGEFTKYGMRITKAGEAICRDDAGTCSRALCECDAMFAKEHVASVSDYQDKYHMFYGNADDWNADDQCVSGGGSTDPKCCGTADGPYFLYNSNNPNKKCCADGTVKADCGDDGEGGY